MVNKFAVFVENVICIAVRWKNHRKSARPGGVTPPATPFSAGFARVFILRSVVRASPDSRRHGRHQRDVRPPLFCVVLLPERGAPLRAVRAAAWGARLLRGEGPAADMPSGRTRDRVPELLLWRRGVSFGLGVGHACVLVVFVCFSGGPVCPLFHQE